MAGLWGRGGDRRVIVDSPLACEGLEPRMLLASYAGIGLDFSDGVFDATIIEGSFSPTGLMVAEMFRSGANGKSDATAFGRDWIEQRDDGRLYLRPIPGMEGYDNERGANFLSSRGYPVGWYGVGNEDGLAGGLSFLVERPAAATVADISGNWVWTTYQWNPTTGIATVLSGTLSASNNFLVWFATGASTPPIARTTEITQVGSGGAFSTSRGEHLFLSADKSVLLTVDMRESDGDLFIGVAVRANPKPTVAGIAGSYRLGAAAASDAAAAFLDAGDTRIGEKCLTLNADGTATLRSLALYDDGDMSGAINGTWTLFDSTITVTFASSGTNLRFTVATNGSTLVSYTPLSGTLPAARALALATRETPIASVTNGLLSYEGIIEAETGRPLVHELTEDGVWRVVDLRAVAAGVAPQTDPGLDVVMWEDPKDGRVYAAVTTVSGLYLYRRSTNGTWDVRNLTAENSGAEVIVSGLTQFTSRNAANQVTIAGLAADGDLLMYRQGTAGANGFAFEFVNVADVYLRPHNMPMPQFVGPLVSYVTPWNGQNVAGLNASGQIEVIWTSNALNGHWVHSNLSTITGAPPFHGGLTVYQTRWKGINIVGIDDDGRVITTWWVPRFGGLWVTSDLTDVADGPGLQDDSVVAFHTPDGGLNIAGLNADGEIVLYWWLPNTDNKWHIRDITVGDNPLIERPIGPLRAQVASDGTVSLFGLTAEGKLVRTWWEPFLDVDDWRLQNVTDCLYV